MSTPADLERQAAAAAADDRREDALDLLRRAREAWRAEGRQPELLRAYAALARQHLAWGQLDEAESAARTAIQQARVWGDPVELGRSLLALGRALARTPRTDRALMALTEASACLRARDPAAFEEAASALRALSKVTGGHR